MDSEQAVKILCEREKYWVELTDSEKIERMRGEVKNWQRKCDRLERALSGFIQHQHGPDGKVLVPFYGEILGPQRETTRIETERF